jgi:hypothetical protein
LPEFRSFRDRKPRPPTAAEARRQRELEERGVADVYVPVEEAPASFWEAVLQAVHWKVLSEGQFESPTGGHWWDELRWQEGWRPISRARRADAFATLLRHGQAGSDFPSVNAHVRLSAVEHLIDVVSHSTTGFSDLVNDAAERFRVGIRLEGNRFVDVTSELVHQEVVRPALQLLANPEFEPVDELYRKGFDRLLAGDPAGAITAATSAMEEMLRIGGCKGSVLKPLAENARVRDWITPGVEQSIVKLAAYRKDSDAHRVGTDERELARLVLHLTASLLVYLGRTRGNVH